MPRWAVILAGGSWLAFVPAALAHGDGTGDVTDGWISRWSVPPVQTALIAAAALLYAWRARRLGDRLPLWRRWCFAAGLAIGFVSVASPIDPIGEDGLVAVHMLQHALLGSLAPLLMVLGITGAVMQPVMRLRHVYPVLHRLTHPYVALPLWAANLIAWHLPPAYDFGVSNPVAHAVQHALFFSTAALLWAPVVEPVPAPRWFGTGPKLAYLLGVWLIGLGFSNVMWFGGGPFYDRYVSTAPEWGFDPVQDQVNAGSVFMAEHMLLVLGALAILAFRWSREGGLRQRLLDAGVEPDTVAQAIRYGRADALARQHGIAERPRPGID